MNDLGQSLNEAFDQLYSSFDSSHTLNFEKLEKAAPRFFDSNHIKEKGEAQSEILRKATLHDSFFQKFTRIWIRYLDQRRLGYAEYFWKRVAELVLSWESQNLGCRIHKGTAYYFWAGTAILSGNLDKGYLLMHQALEEDKITHPNAQPLPNTPSFVFVTLDYKDPRQTFKVWVEGQVKFIDKLLLEYRNSYSKHLTSDDFRSRFLKCLSEISLVVLFAYTLARFYNLAETPSYAQKSDFAGQLEMNLLFDLALIIEVAIKQKSGIMEGTLGNQINDYLLRDSRINSEFTGWNNNTLGQLRDNKSKPDTTFQQSLNELLSTSPFLFNDGSQLTTRAEKDLALTYLIRNRGAHYVTPVEAIWERFTKLRQSLFNVLFLCVETLYP